MKLRRVGILMLALLLTHSVFPANRKAKAVYCVDSADGKWRLERWRPLINPHSHTVFAEISFLGDEVDEVRLRSFYPDHEVLFEYKFDPTGKLIRLFGSVDMWGSWLAEANLYPESDGTVGKVDAKFYATKDRNRIARPEGSNEYEAELGKVPVYRTIESIPCGSRLKEAEKMNATQE